MKWHYDCHPATWLQIEPNTGWAPPVWQNWVGSTLLYRSDGADFTADDFSLAFEYVALALDRFGDGPERPFFPFLHFSPEPYKRWFRERCHATTPKVRNDHARPFAVPIANSASRREAGEAAV